MTEARPALAPGGPCPRCAWPNGIAIEAAFKDPRDDLRR